MGPKVSSTKPICALYVYAICTHSSAQNNKLLTCCHTLAPVRLNTRSVLFIQTHHCMDNPTLGTIMLPSMHEYCVWTLALLKESKRKMENRRQKTVLTQNKHFWTIHSQNECTTQTLSSIFSARLKK